jgi:hypothetical protein
MPYSPFGRILAVDPGKWYAGVALFNQKTLVDADLVAYPHEKTERGEAHAAVYIGRFCAKYSPVHSCVVENQVIRRQRTQRGRQADIIPLARTNGAILACVEANERVIVHYATWASSRSAEALPTHVRSRLSVEETAVLQRKGLYNNEHVIDAVGIGLWATARM